MKTPKQKWLIVYNAAKIPSEMIGIRVFGDAKVNWYSCMPGVLGLIYFYTVFYALWFYYQRNEVLRGLQATCTFGMVTSVSIQSILI